MADHDELDPFLATIARELRRPVHLDVRFDDRVMTALEPGILPLPVTHRAAQPWYRRSRSFTVTPLRAMAAAAALAGIVALGATRLRPTTASQVARIPDSLTLQPVANTAAAVSDGVRYQQFIIVVPDAREVSVVGDFNDWDGTLTPMERVADDGTWSVTVPLRPGRYEFQYEVDGGRRLSDPSRPQTSSDFGSPNSVVTVEGGGNP